MSYINNFNPRRMIWFNQHEPKNKMDLWLSYNRHYTEDENTSEESETTDNPNQRTCDLILKAWDCGTWIPIVGFNTTSANKIDIVEGNTLYHPAIFTGENPNDLYDAGTLGELLANTNFVTETEWQNLFDTTQFQNAFNNLIIDGNDYNWSTLINDNIDFATTSQCGGILSATHTYDELSAFKPIEVKFYPMTSTYSSKLHRLCVSASDVIEQINDYYNDNPSGQSLSIPLATTSKIGGIKSDVHSYDVVSAFKPVECKFYPNQGTWSSLYERLCINADDVIDLFIASFDSEYPLLIDGNGITIGQASGHSQITWEVSNLRYAEDGKYARSKVIDGNHTIEWVDLPEGTEYTDGVGIYINSNDNTININTSSGSSGLVLAINDAGTGVVWKTLQSSGSYTGTNLIKVSGSTIGIDVTTDVPASGDVISYVDNTVKWVTPQGSNNYTAGIGINIQSNKISQNIEKVTPGATGTITQIRIDWAGARDKFTVTYENDYDEDVELYEMIDFADVLSLSVSGVEYYITLIPFNTNPSYFILRNVKDITLVQNLEFINMPSSFSDIEGVLVTILFGVVKFEVIEKFVNNL